MQCNILKKTIFQIIFSRNLKGSANFQLRKEGPKELLHQPISDFHVDERSYFFPKISNILVFRTDNVM